MIMLIVIFSILPTTYCSKKHKTVLFISIPFIGHVNPLLRQAIELQLRPSSDYNIYIVSCSNVKAHIEQGCVNTTIRFLDIGECYNATKFNYLLEQAASDSNLLLSNLPIFRLVMEEIYPSMYQKMLDTIHLDILNDSSSKVVVTDILTYAGAHFADDFKIPFIVNNADLLPSLSWFDIVPADYNPTMLLNPPQSIHSMGSNLLQRTIFPVTRFLLQIYAYFSSLETLASTPKQNLPSKNLLQALMKYNSHMILVNSVWGLEYSHSLPPYVQMTGPMLSTKLSVDDYLALLSDEDRQWVDSDPRPIIYVSFGTCVPLSNEQIQKIGE